MKTQTVAFTIATELLELSHHTTADDK